MYVGALDLGTSGCRTFIFNLGGEVLSSAYTEWESYFPTSSYVEQDANIWWESIKDTISLAIKKSGIDPSEIVSISITNQKF